MLGRLFLAVWRRALGGQCKFRSRATPGNFVKADFEASLIMRQSYLDKLCLALGLSDLAYESEQIQSSWVWSWSFLSQGSVRFVIGVEVPDRV